MKRKSKILFLTFASIGLIACALPTKAVQTDAYFAQSADFSDEFDGKTIKDEWVTSKDVSLHKTKSSLRLYPTQYEWGGHIILSDYKIQESVKIRYDIESIETQGWFAFSFGAPNKNSPFYDSQGAFVFYANGTGDVFDHDQKSINSETGKKLSCSPLATQRSYVEVDLIKQFNGRYISNLRLYNSSNTLIGGDSNISFPSLDGYIGFNSNYASVEIYSITISDLNSNPLYVEEFDDSVCSYPDKSEADAKWNSTTFGEGELKIGNKNRLNLSKVDEYAVYSYQYANKNDSNLDRLYSIETSVFLGSQDIDIDTGIEIGKDEISSKGLFIGLRKKTFGFSLVAYDLNNNLLLEKTTTVERADMCVDLKINVYNEGRVEISANDLEDVITSNNIFGYFGLISRNHLSGGSGNGGMICSFELSTCKYIERGNEDLGQNFDGLKITEDHGYQFRSFYYNQQTWYTGENIKLPMYRDDYGGNGYVTFAGASPYSAIGPRVKFAEAIVRFDVTIPSSANPEGACFGLQFGKDNISKVYENAQSLGFSSYTDIEKATGTGYMTNILATNCEFLDGYNEALMIGGKRADIFRAGSKYTLMYVIKNNIITMSYKNQNEDDSVLLTPVAKVKAENTDGYIAIYGANGLVFSVDNISITNLDYNAPTGNYSYVDDYQGTTRYNFAKDETFSGVKFINGSVYNGALELNENGKLVTSKDVSNYILRFKTKNVENTLRIRKGNLLIDLVSEGGNKIVVNDGVNIQTINLDKTFSFTSAYFEIMVFGSELQISYVSGINPFGRIIYSCETLEINPTYDYESLEIISIDGISSLLEFQVFNLDSKVKIETQNYNADTDLINPWPKRPTNNYGCKGSIIASSIIVLAIAVCGLVLLIIKKKENENE